MRFGINISGLVQFHPAADPRERLDEIVTWVQRIEALGLDYVYFGQHYLTEPYAALQAVPLLARLTAETERLGLGATLIVPLHHPVELAERLATVDVLAAGRLFLSAAMGYRKNEFAAFGLDITQRGDRYREAVALMRRLWAEERVDFSGEHFDVQGARLMLRPSQEPHPPVWVAANGDRMVRWAAHNGLPWHINPHARRSTIDRQLRVYRQAAADADQPVLQNVLNREVFCAPSAAAAWQLAGPHLAAKYDSYADWGQDRQLPADELSFRSELEDLAQDRFILGAPSSCIEQLRQYMPLGVGAMHFRIGWPGMDAVVARGGLELIASEVVPELRRVFSGNAPGRSPFEAVAPSRVARRDRGGRVIRE